MRPMPRLLAIEQNAYDVKCIRATLPGDSADVSSDRRI